MEIDSTSSSAFTDQIDTLKKSKSCGNEYTITKIFIVYRFRKW